MHQDMIDSYVWHDPVCNMLHLFMWHEFIRLSRALCSKCCIMLQHAATHCNTLQHTARWWTSTACCIYVTRPLLEIVALTHSHVSRATHSGSLICVTLICVTHNSSPWLVNMCDITLSMINLHDSLMCVTHASFSHGDDWNLMYSFSLISMPS